MIAVSPAALPDDLALMRFQGVWVGSRHIEGAVNLDDWARQTRSGAILPNIDAWSRAGIVAFHTWINASDEQVVVRMADGRLYSIDHGDCFRTLMPGRPSRIVVVQLFGVPDDLGRDWSLIEPHVSRIENLTEDEILAFVAGIPDEPGWGAMFERRLDIAKWLIDRQPHLREELSKWAPRLS